MAKQKEKEIEILRTGTHTASNGQTVTFDISDLEEIAKTYNPRHFKAPLIVGHDNKGLEDEELEGSEFAFGFPKKLKVVGDRLKANFSNINKNFIDWVRDGKLLSISPSIYLKDSPSNPYPGKYSLRHIAALGKSPPAIKGLEPLYLNELINGCLSFTSSNTEQISADFLCQGCEAEFTINTSGSVPDSLRGLREWMIEKFGLEASNLALPITIINQIEEEGKEQKYKIKYLTKALSELKEKNTRLQNESFGKVAELELPQVGQIPASFKRKKVANYREGKGYKKFGEMLSKAMSDLGVDSDTGAESTGIDSARLVILMEGKELPSIKEKKALVKALGLRPDYFDESLSMEESTVTEPLVLMFASPKMMKRMVAKIKSAMDESGLKDAVSLARAAGVGVESVNTLLKGKVEQPNKKFVEKIATTLGLELTELMNEKEEEIEATEEKGLEDEVEVKQDVENQITELQEQVLSYKEQIEKLKQEKEEAENEAANYQEQIRRKDIQQFCKELIAEGKLREEQLEERNLEFEEGGEAMLTLVDFLLGLDRTQIEFMESFLNDGIINEDNRIISYGEFAGEAGQDNYQGLEGLNKPPAGYQFSERTQELAEIKAFCKEHNLDFDCPSDFRTAAKRTKNL